MKRLKNPVKEIQMCMGYANEIKAWVCADDRSQLEAMMGAWSCAFEAEADDPGVQPDSGYGSPAFSKVSDLTRALASPLHSRTTN